jgi:catechol 2,3-dioxygenase-like lactoylglutathione lyase family enzyme
VVGLAVLAASGKEDLSHSNQASSRPRILGISLVRFRVTDFCKGQEFYSKILGRRSNCPDDQKPAGGEIALSSSQLITLNANALMAESQANLSSLLEEVGFWTDDVPGLEKYLKSRDIAVEKIGDQSPSLVVRDPEGHRISFNKVVANAVKSVPEGPIQPRIIHAGFVVHDRAAEDKFYKDVLGFHVYWHGGMKDGEDNWVDMQVPDGTDWVEYMLRVSPDASHKTLGVMNHIALGVPDIHAAQQQLIKNGWKGEEPKIGRDGKWQLNLYDPDETRVELMEFKPTKEPCCSPYTGPHPGPKQ